MRRLVIFRTIITFLLIGIVACFGAYAVLMSVKSVKSKLNINIVNTGLDLYLAAEADWVSVGDPNRTFTTETTASGLTDESWDLPDLNFSSVQPKIELATFTIFITNRNTSAISPMNIVLDGLAYDDQASFGNYRFRTYITHKIDEGLPSAQQEVREGYTSYAISNIEGSASRIVITIQYDLELRNSNFEFDQYVELTISKGSVE